MHFVGRVLTKYNKMTVEAFRALWKREKEANLDLLLKKRPDSMSEAIVSQGIDLMTEVLIHIWKSERGICIKNHCLIPWLKIVLKHLNSKVLV